MFNKLKQTREDVDNTVEGVKYAGKAVTKFKEAKEKVMAWMGDNPEKVVLIFLGAITTAVISGEVRRSKTEVNVHINITPEMLTRVKK